MIALSLLALLVAIPAIMAAAKVGSALIAGVGSGIAAIAVVFLSLTKDALTEAITTGRARRAAVDDGCVMIAGRLPVVRELSDPVQFGVHRARPDDGAVDLPPVYVPRDIDPRLRELLASGGFVLVVGDSTAGKSRAAFQAMTETLPNHVVIAPQNRPALLSGLEVATLHAKCVLWLDDIEQFLGVDGLTRTRIGRFRDRPGGHRVILATVRSAELARYIDPDPSVAQAQHDVVDALEQAEHLYLSRTFTVTERGRAASRTWDRRIADALEHSDDFGLAEYLAAARELLDLWHANAESGPHRRGAALVAAAVDCRRSGMTSPLPRRLIEQLHENYLPARGRITVPADDLEQAWAWALQLRTTTALITPSSHLGAECVNVFDYLVDHTDRTAGPVPDITLASCTSYAGPSDALRIGITTARSDRHAFAHAAYTQARAAYSNALGPDHPDTLKSRSAFGVALAGLGRYAEAETEARAVLHSHLDAQGPDHPDTLRSRIDLANALTGQRRYAEAETEHETILDGYVRTHGPDHPDTLRSRCNLAVDYSHQGRYADAEACHRTVLEARIRTLGEDHPDTVRSRVNLAIALASQGRHAEADVEDLAVIDSLNRIHGPDHPELANSRQTLQEIRQAARGT